MSFDGIGNDSCHASSKGGASGIVPYYSYENASAPFNPLCGPGWSTTALPGQDMAILATKSDTSVTNLDLVAAGYGLKSNVWVE